MAERAAAAVPPDHQLSVEQMRDRADISTAHLELGLAAHSADRELAGPGGPLPVRVVTPLRPPVGVVVYALGGGHVTGTLDSYDRLTRGLSAAVPATVVLVGYRRAPEHRWPAAVDDVEAAYLWAVENRAELAGDSAAVAVVGDSAGGHLAAVVSRRQRDAARLLHIEQVRDRGLARHLQRHLAS